MTEQTASRDETPVLSDYHAGLVEDLRTSASWYGYGRADAGDDERATPEVALAFGDWYAEQATAFYTERRTNLPNLRHEWPRYLDQRDVHRRVAAGATLLDARVPGWADRVDLGSLEMDSTVNCVLGQLAPSHGVYVGDDEHVDWEEMFSDVLGIAPDSSEEFITTALVMYGFSLEGAYDEMQYLILDEAWRPEIASRQGTVSLTDPDYDGPWDSRQS